VCFIYGINCSVVDAFRYRRVGKRSTVVILSRAWGSASPEADPEAPIAQSFLVFLRSPNYRQPYHVELHVDCLLPDEPDGKKGGARVPAQLFHIGHRLLVPGFLHLRSRSWNKKRKW